MQLIPRNPRKSPLIQYGGFFYAVALPQEVQIKMNKNEISNALKRNILDGSRFNELISRPTGQKKQLQEGDTFYTVQAMKVWVTSFYKQVASLAKFLQKSTLQATCINIHSFLYNYIQYQIDFEVQNLRSPSNSWDNRKAGIDCKSYSIFASSLLTNLGIKHYIRQIKQVKISPKNYTHVYVVIPKDQTTGSLANGYFTIDGTLQKTSEPIFTKFKDVFMSKLPHLGLNAPTTKKKTVAKKKSITAKKLCSAVIVKDGLKKDGTLKKNHKYIKGGKIVKAKTKK